MERKFFALNPDVFLVKGAKRGAIYDLKSGNVFSVDNISANILESLEQGKSVEESMIKRDNFSPEEIYRYLLKISNSGLGAFVRSDHSRIKLEIKEPRKELAFMHFELTAKCNLKCKHCYVGSSSKENQKGEIVFENYIRALREAHDLGCRGFQLIGGEPLLRRDLLFDIVIGAKKMSYDFFEIFSNGTLITDNDLNVIKRLNISLAISLHDSRSEIHDYIVQRNGSWKKTIAMIKKANKIQIPIRVAIVAMKHNESNVRQTIKFVRDKLHIKEEKIKVDYVRPSGRGCSISLDSIICEKQRLHKPQFSNISVAQFVKMKRGHNCFLDKICISSDGNVHPCIMERKTVYGNIKKQGLKSILSSKIAKKYQKLSKDFVDICKVCEYRYCCFDCRVKARAYDEDNLYAKPWWCGYDPQLGKWI